MLKYRALSHLDKQAKKGVPTPASRGPWVYLVEEKKTNKQFVMRKIEVEDQTIADSAEKHFNEIITFTQEKRVLPYKECFVTFSKLDSALYLCLIGDYCPGGSLRALLANRNESDVAIGEGEVKRWYGELLEGLEGIHREQRLHRRIKSSNVFVRDGGLMLGCLGLQTEEEDIKRESSLILPPEYRNKTANDLSYSFDIWCFGVILTELCTSGVITRENLRQILNKDENELKKLLDIIEDRYNIEIANVISSCLKFNPLNRCTVQFLCSLPFSQDCLSLINSPLLARIRSEETINLPTAPSVPYSTIAVFQYMRDNSEVRQCQLIGIEKLLICVNENHEKLNNSEKRFLRNILKQYMNLMLFQLSVIRLFVSCMRDLEDNPMEVLLTHPYVDIVSKIAILQTDPTEVFSHCCVYLLLVSHHEDNPTRIANHRIIPHILTISSHNITDNTTWISPACSLLWSLTVTPENLRTMTELNTLEWTLNIINRYGEDTAIFLSCANLLHSLCQDKINLEKAYYYDITKTCIDSLHGYSAEQDTCVCVLNILILICKIESCAFQLLADESLGLTKLLEFLNQAIPHPSIADRIVSLLNVLFTYKDLKEEILSLELRDILSERFKEDLHPKVSEFIQSLDT